MSDAEIQALRKMVEKHSAMIRQPNPNSDMNDELEAMLADAREKAAPPRGY